MRVVVSGGTGLIGSALGASLAARGDDVTVLSRGAARAGVVHWDPERGDFDPGVVDGVDAVVNLAGTSIGERRWSDEVKASLRESRVRATSLLAEAIAAADAPPAVFVAGSAVGFYGDRGDDPLDESSAAGSGFLAGLVREWEAATTPAASVARVAIARTGVVLSASGGALARQLLPFRLGLGGRVGSGQQWLPWISLRDQVRALEFLLDSNLAGAVNLVAPEPVRQIEFARTLAKVLHRPAFAPTPLVALRALLGRELVEELLLSSQRVLPARLAEAGFEFVDPTLMGALHWELGRR